MMSKRGNDEIYSEKISELQQAHSAAGRAGQWRACICMQPQPNSIAIKRFTKAGEKIF